MKNCTNVIVTLNMVLLILASCSSQDVDFSDDCVEGLIPNDILYKLIYEECYTNSLWIEVLNDDRLGKDVKIYTPAPTGQPNPPSEYTNIIEVPIPDQLSQNNRIDTLLGKKIYFQYRLAKEGEISTIRNTECTEIYDTYGIPILVLTHFSFDNCPKTSDF